MILTWLTVVAALTAVFVFVLFCILKLKYLFKPKPLSTLQLKDKEISDLKSHIEFLEENLRKTKDIYISVLLKLKEVRNKNTVLSCELTQQKEKLSSIQQDQGLLQKEKTLFQKKIASEQRNIDDLSTQNSKVKNELGKQHEHFAQLEVENKNLLTRLKEIEACISALSNKQNNHSQYVSIEQKAFCEKITHLKDKVNAQNIIIEEYKKIAADGPAKPQLNNSGQTIAYPRQILSEHIDDLLLQDKIITKDIAQQAHGCLHRHGGSIIAFLLSHKLSDEDTLAAWIISRFKVPYIPLSAYTISLHVIKLLPLDIAQKYWVMPIEKIANVLIIAMLDPLNTEAIKIIEEATDCNVQIYLGRLSEIRQAHKDYYKIPAQNKNETSTAASFETSSDSYDGAERRKWTRIDVRLPITCAENGHAQKTNTINISRGGLAFYSKKAFGIGSFITLEINLPNEISPAPVCAVAKIVRSAPADNKRFAIGAETIKIPKQDLNTVMRYASAVHIGQEILFEQTTHTH